MCVCVFVCASAAPQISSQKDDQTQIFHQGLAEASKSSGTNNNNNNGHAPEYPSPLQVDVQVPHTQQTAVLHTARTTSFRTPQTQATVKVAARYKL